MSLQTFEVQYTSLSVGTGKPAPASPVQLHEEYVLYRAARDGRITLMDIHGTPQEFFIVDLRAHLSHEGNHRGYELFVSHN